MNKSQIGDPVCVASQYGADNYQQIINACALLELILNFVLTIAILLLIKWTKRNARPNGICVQKLRGHNLRNLINLFLTVVCTLTIIESVIRTVYSSTNEALLDTGASVLHLCVTILILVFYDALETYCSSPTLLVWCSVTRGLQLIPISCRIVWNQCWIIYSSVYVSLQLASLVLIATAASYDAICAIMWKWRLTKQREPAPEQPTVRCQPSKDSQTPRPSRPSVSFNPDACVTSYDPKPDDGLKYVHDATTFFSRHTFTWYVAVIRRGRARALEFSDIDSVPEQESSELQFNKFLHAYQTIGNVSKSILSIYWRRLFVGGLYKFLGDSVNVIGPLVILPIVSYVRHIQQGTWTLQGYNLNGMYLIGWHEFVCTGWVLAWFALVASILQSTFSQKSSHIMTMEGMHARTSLQVTIYKKSLRMAIWGQPQKDSEETEASGDTAEVINITSDDCDNIMSFITQCHYLWAIPVKVAILIGLLYWQLGIAAVTSALLTILILVPLQFLVIKKIAAVSKSLTDATDERLRRTHELIALIKNIKVNGWQHIFVDRIDQARSVELCLLFRDAILRALMTFLTQSSGILVVLLAFGLYSVLSDDSLDSGKVFASLALFSQLTVPLFILPSIVVHTIKAKRSITRIETYLSHQEVSPQLHGNSDQFEDNMKETDSQIAGNRVLTVNNGSFSMDSSNEGLVLESISTDIIEGDLTVVVGGVGCGKTSFLLALLGELNQLEGQLSWNKKYSMAYVSQTPWLLNCTLKENILFGKPLVPSRYKKVLTACALDPDIEILPYGDETEIGEQGVNLSGGQRQRVAIARAVYSDASVVVMDSPFSALDAPVSQQVFQKAVVDFLLKKKKTVILATQHPRLAIHAHKVIFINHKTIECQGTVAEVSTQIPRTWNLWMSSWNIDRSTAVQQSTDRERSLLRKNTRRLNLTRSRKFLSNQMDDYKDEDTSQYKSILRHTPFGVMLPGISSPETTNISTRTSSSNRALFRTYSTNPSNDSSPALSRPIDRRFTKSLPAQPRPAVRKRDKKLTRDSSIIKKIFNATSFKLKTSLEPAGACERHDSIEERSSVEDECMHMMDLSDKEVYGAVLDEEERQRGRISKWNYVAYLKACGYALGIFYLLFSGFNQGIAVFLDVWLGQWSKTDSNQTSVSSYRQDDEIAENQKHMYLLVFAVVSALSVLVVLGTICLAQLAAHAGRRAIHDTMLRSVIRAPMQFFDVNPSGRILNRFATDMSMIDKEVGWSLMHLVYFSLLCGSAIVVNMVISPAFIIISIPICGAYYVVQNLFRRSSRELKRLESVSLSPLVSLISETTSAPVTIRAHDMQHQFVACYQQRLDNYLSVSILLHSGTRWLGISLDYLGALVVFLATAAGLFGTLGTFGPMLSPAEVGMVIKYTLVVPVYLNWLVRFLSDTEMCLNSLERIHQYSDTPSEQTVLIQAANEAGSNSTMDPPTYTYLGNTIKKDILVFDKVHLFYARNQTAVVTDISFAITRGEKVGICGRTGSGKSSLFMGLLRFVESQSGTILLDGRDTTSFTPETLRSHISTLLQETQAFQDTIRFNLDPEELHDDSELWTILEDVRLEQFVKRLPEKLDSVIGMNNFALSAGQLQLLCLARTILQKKPLVLMDEATSSLDPHTEKSMLELLRQKMPHSTILSIAHNVQSLLNYDRLLVMQNGQLVEDGEPAALADQNGVFASLLNASSNLTMSL